MAYFTSRKEASFGDFDGLRARTVETIAKVEQALDALVPLLPDAQGASIDDIHLFPMLRGLTIVNGLTLPDAVANYTRGMAERCGTPLVPELRAAEA